MYYNATREDPEIYCSMKDSLAMELSEKQALAELPTAVRREFERARGTGMGTGRVVPAGTLDAEPWFYGALSRAGAERLLVE
jgi:hypothetical protein